MLEVKQLTKRFGRHVAVDNASFQVDEGEVFGYLGPNGSGKTTTMRLILGLLKPTSGQALLWGGQASDRPDIRRRVGVLLEADGLYPKLSAYDNLAYFGRLYRVPGLEARIERLLGFAGLAARRNDKAGTFSRGMRRKLGLIRALLHSPDLLLLDEPSAGLDPEAQKMVRDLIVTLSSEANITVFLSSHDLDEVQRICGRIAIIQAGRIRVCDTLKALQSSSGAQGVEFVLSDGSRLLEAASLLRGRDGVGTVETRNRSVHVDLVQERVSPALLALLEEHGIGVDEFRRGKRSLEDVYLDIVRQEDSNG
jgi:ABC-2 type transport system ATP-binding protein